MAELTRDQLARLAVCTAPHGLAPVVGGAVLAGGLWRLFSLTSPAGGVHEWNAAWRAAWDIAGDGPFAFGEDIFGNQLVIASLREPVHIWDHESGELFDTQLPLAELLGAALDHGLGWIDFYPAGSLAVARAFLDRVGWADHLHWVHPLFLNGAVTEKNVAIVPRLPHITGHAGLWRQIAGLAPGEEIDPR